eukprot:scaffold1340_cov122-Cylindrotheca_fusiformis.AAC.2
MGESKESLVEPESSIMIPPPPDEEDEKVEGVVVTTGGGDTDSSSESQSTSSSAAAAPKKDDLKQEPQPQQQPQATSQTKASKKTIFQRIRHYVRPYYNYYSNYSTTQQDSSTSSSSKPRVIGGVRLRGCLTDEDHRTRTRSCVQALKSLRGKEGLRMAGFEYRTTVNVVVNSSSTTITTTSDNHPPRRQQQDNNVDCETKRQEEKATLDATCSADEDDDDHKMTRLFHIESNTMITQRNRKQFIADGDMYDAIARVCQEYAQDVMQQEGNLKWITLSSDDEDEANNSNNKKHAEEPIRALVSASIHEDSAAALDTTPTLLIATGKGKVRAGIFSRQHLLLSGMECSTALPIVREAQKRNMNVIMIDPNIHGDRFGMATFQKSMSTLFQRWEKDDEENNDDDVVVSSNVSPPPLGKRDLFVLSHSQSGAQFARYLLDKSKHYLPHIRAVAFTDSNHNIQWARQDKELQQLLQSEKSVYFKVSKEASSSNDSLSSSLSPPLNSVGTELETDNHWQHRFGQISTRCAGTADHSLTNWFARSHIWEHFDRQLLLQNQETPSSENVVLDKEEEEEDVPQQEKLLES